MPNVDRLSLFSKSAFRQGAGINSVGLKDKIDFDQFPDNAASVFDHGIVFKFSADDVQSAFPGYGASGCSVKQILFAPRVCNMLLGFSFIYTLQSYSTVGQYQHPSGTFSTSAGYFDLSSLQGLDLTGGFQSPAPGAKGFSAPFNAIKFNNDGSVSVDGGNFRVNVNSQNDGFMYFYSLYFFGEFFAVSRQNYYESTIYHQFFGGVKDPKYKRIFPDSWFV